MIRILRDRGAGIVNPLTTDPLEALAIDENLHDAVIVGRSIGLAESDGLDSSIVHPELIDEIVANDHCPSLGQDVDLVGIALPPALTGDDGKGKRRGLEE